MMNKKPVNLNDNFAIKYFAIPNKRVIKWRVLLLIFKYKIFENKPENLFQTITIYLSHK